MTTLADYQRGWRILEAYAAAGHFIADDGSVVLRGLDDLDKREELRNEVQASGDC